MPGEYSGLNNFFSPPSDCSDTSTNPLGIYSPSALPVLEIQVVFHVIQNTAGVGNIPDTAVFSQMEVFNEDFRAMAGTPGGMGLDTRVQFKLASVDPMGNPTIGITRHTNDTWFSDMGGYEATLAWDTTRYMNIYTNQPAAGLLGYATFPQSPEANTPADKVVLVWNSVGKNSPAGAPYDQGRTGTHEVGHQLGLYHPFEGSCDTAAGCNASGDTICDTNNQMAEFYGCGTNVSCGNADPTENYMNYSNDTCMNTFTEEQARRMRCSMQFYRPNLGTIVEPGASFCTAAANSTGNPSHCTATGTPSLAALDLVITADNVPSGSMGYFIASKTQGLVMMPGGYQGNLCLSGSIGRITSQIGTSTAGTISLNVNSLMVPQPTAPATIVAGERWSFQLWYRDMNPTSTANFSDGYSVVFTQ